MGIDSQTPRGMVELSNSPFTVNVLPCVTDAVLSVETADVEAGKAVRVCVHYQACAELAAAVCFRGLLCVDGRADVEVPLCREDAVDPAGRHVSTLTFLPPHTDPLRFDVDMTCLGSWPVYPAAPLCVCVCVCVFMCVCVCRGAGPGVWRPRDPVCPLRAA